MSSRLTKREFQRHVLFCQPGTEGRFMIHGTYGWVPCTDKQQEFILWSPRMGIAEFGDDPHRRPQRDWTRTVGWFDEQAWVERGVIEVTR